MAACATDPKSELERRQSINKATAIVIPLILVGIIGYATWVVVVLVAAHYLIKGDATAGINSRPAAGIAIIVVYFVLLLPCAATYIRLLGSVRDPGYVETGRALQTPIVRQKEQKHGQVTSSRTSTQLAARPQTAASNTKSESELSSIGPHGQHVTTLDLEAIFKGDVPPPPGLENYYTKDVFACDPNGLPIWCGTCCNWKPDRSHHCSDVGRCVMKLDHFCPWVGGVVAENNFKFFIQFNSYTCLYTLFILITMAYFVHDRSARGHGLDVNWVIILGLAGMFTLFTGGMAGMSINLAVNNLTTIDNIDHESRTMYVAVHINDPSKRHQPPSAIAPPSNPSPPNAVARTATKTSLSRHSRPRSLDRSGFEPGECSRLMFKGSAGSKHRTPSPDRNEPPLHPWIGNITYPLYTRPLSSASGSTKEATYLPPPRNFAILRTRPGMNPWSLGPSKNWESIMGHHVLDWLLPLRRSPCCNHSRGDTLYELGPDLDRLRRDAGIDMSSDAPDSAHSSTGTHRRRRHSRKRRHRREEESPDSIASSTMANVDGLTGRDPVPRISPFSVSSDS